MDTTVATAKAAHDPQFPWYSEQLCMDTTVATAKAAHDPQFPWYSEDVKILQWVRGGTIV
jgi:hypothetical protein